MNKNLEDELKIIELDGYWWVPGMPQEKRYGHMRHSVNSTYVLQLIENYALSALSLCGGKDDVLRGVCLPAKHVTLLRLVSRPGFPNSLSSLEMSDVKVFSPFAIIGDYGFEREEDIAFTEISFGVTNLLPWCGWSLEIMSDNRFGKTKLTPIVIFQDAQIQANVVPEFSYHCSDNVQQYEYYAKVVIYTKNAAMPYFGKTNNALRFYERRIATLLCILVGRDGVTYSHAGVVKVENGHHRVRLIPRRPMPKPQDVKELILSDLVIAPYRNVKENIQAIAKKIVDMEDGLFAQIERFVYLSTCCRDLTYEMLPRWIFMFEGVASRVFKGMCLDADEDKFVRMHFKHKTSQIQKYFVLARRSARHIFRVFDDDEVFWNFMEDMRKCRNEFAHNTGEFTINEDKRVAGVYLMMEIVRLIILDCLGALPANATMSLNNDGNIRFALSRYGLVTDETEQENQFIA